MMMMMMVMMINLLPDLAIQLWNSPIWVITSAHMSYRRKWQNKTSKLSMKSIMLNRQQRNNWLSSLSSKLEGYFETRGAPRSNNTRQQIISISLLQPLTLCQTRSFQTGFPPYSRISLSSDLLGCLMPDLIDHTFVSTQSDEV